MSAWVTITDLFQLKIQLSTILFHSHDCSKKLFYSLYSNYALPTKQIIILCNSDSFNLYLRQNSALKPLLSIRSYNFTRT